MSERYDGPLETGMVLTAPDNEGRLGYRRDKLLARHPDKEGFWIYESLPCRIRRPAGLVGLIPEENVRIVMRPEVASIPKEETEDELIDRLAKDGVYDRDC